MAGEDLPFIIATALATALTAAGTIVLAKITKDYVHETRLIRQGSQQPGFSLEPSLYSLGGTFHQLHLVNNGATATQIRVDCKWEKIRGEGGSGKSFYIVSLSRGSFAQLHGVPIAEIVRNGELITAKISCTDSRNEPYEVVTQIDFGLISKEGREIAYQANPGEQIERTLKRIYFNRGD
jgi:hypothetical protein